MSFRRFAAAMASAALLACTSYQSHAAGALSVSQYARITATLPWAVASEKGFFAEEGIKLDQIVAGAGGGTTLRNMLASDLQYGEVATSAALAAIRSGVDLVIVNTASDHIGEIALVASPKGDIHKVQDLEGKKAGFTNPKSTSEMLLRMALKESGMTGKVEPVATGGFGGGLTMLDVGGIAAAPLTDPTLTLKPDKYRVIFHFADLIPRMTWLVGVTTRKFAQEHPGHRAQADQDSPARGGLHLRAPRRCRENLRQILAAKARGRRHLLPEIFRLQGRMVARRLRQGRAQEDVGRARADRRIQGPGRLESGHRPAVPARGPAQAAVAVRRRVKTSQKRILTTHVGSLPRSDAVVALLETRENGMAFDTAAFDRTMAQAVADVVQRQVAIGIDAVSDGETSKISYATYVKDRLKGFAEEGATESAKPHLDLQPFPDLRAKMAVLTGKRRFKRVACVGPVAVRDRASLKRDLENMRRAKTAAGPADAFLNAASPGVVASFLPNQYYPSHEAYVEAVAVAMREEYEAIVAAGFVLQIDCPDLAMSRHAAFQDLSEDEFLKRAQFHVEALNHALANVPATMVRVHVCWGNYEGPHTHDIALAKILPWCSQ